MKRTSIILVMAALLTSCADSDMPLGPGPEAQLAKAPSGVWTVTTLADGPAGPCTGGSCTLRDAFAAAQDGDRIVFKNNVSGTILLTAGPLTTMRSITIEGNGRISIDAQGASRVLNVHSLLAHVTLSGLTLTGGYDAVEGGAIWNFGELTLIDCVVTGNSTAGAGGGIYNPENLTLIGTTITGNTAANGGGIRNGNFGNTVVIASTISGNHATSNGGGIHNTGMLTVSRSTISGNSSPFVGGIYTSAPAIGNTGATITSSTVTRNSSSGIFAGGLYSGGVTTTMSNTIIAGNISQIAPDCEGNFASLGHNLTGSGGCPSSGAGDVVVIPSQIFTHVLDAELADNGGPTQTHALVERGRAVDAGYCPGETMDQRGVARPFDEPLMPNALDACDIGAFEWRPAATTQPGRKPKK